MMINYIPNKNMPQQWKELITGSSFYMFWLWSSRNDFIARFKRSRVTWS